GAPRLLADAARSLRDLGRAARAAAARRLRRPCARIRRRPRLARAGGRDPAPQACGDRGRGRRLRPAAQVVRLRRRSLMRVRSSIVVLAALAAVALAGCGGAGSSPPQVPTVQVARTYKLAGFTPSSPVPAGKPVTVSFTIRQPSGEALTDYKRGSGPHTGVHLIIVRDDLGAIIHRHPPVAPSGRLTEHVVFPKPGPYRVVVDAYPNTTGPQRNFQLFGTIHVAGAYKPQPLPPFAPTETVDGYRFHVQGRPHLKAIEAGFLHITVDGPSGKPARFTPWYGALAH